MELKSDTILEGKFRITRLLGEGAMGSVYEGEHIRISRRIAIKVMKPEARVSRDAMQRFEREAQASGLIRNDHVLEVLDLGYLEDGLPYMVTEFLDGESLAQRFERTGPLSDSELLPLARQLLVGLSAAHRVKIVHRDLKPENIFILQEKAGHRDFVKIIDFGVSKFSEPTSSDKTAQQLTTTGTILGTPYYMSPEQARGSSQIDHRSDLYALGTVLYQALTGTVPFDADSVNGLLFNIATGNCRRKISDFPEVDQQLAAVIERAMALEPDKRFQNAEEFLNALDTVSPQARTSGNKPSRAGQDGVRAAHVGASNMAADHGTLVSLASQPKKVSSNPALSPADLGRTREERIPKSVLNENAAGGRTANTWSRPRGDASGHNGWKIATFAVIAVATAALGLVIARGFGGSSNGGAPSAPSAASAPIDDHASPATSGSPSIRAVGKPEAPAASAAETAEPSSVLSQPDPNDSYDDHQYGVGEPAPRDWRRERDERGFAPGDTDLPAHSRAVRADRPSLNRSGPTVAPSALVKAAPTVTPAKKPTPPPVVPTQVGAKSSAPDPGY